MAGDELFGRLPNQARPQAADGGRGAPRLREPVRDQVELRAVDIDSLLGLDHAARLIWAYVQQLDLSELEDAIKSREGTPGHPTITPRLLMALWLYATSEGVGSARALERLCESHDAYRWLCGGVSVNYHTLSDFRVAHGDLLDRLLTENLAALCANGLIDVNTLAQDGVRVRASAGAASFRRRATLEQHLVVARETVERLKRELDGDPGISNQRIHAAKERAARERAERVEAALATLSEVEAQRKQRKQTTDKNGKKLKEPRASTTDPQARVMKMADGGFRPAYNVQVVSTAGEQIVIDVAPLSAGSDRGLKRCASAWDSCRTDISPTAVSPRPTISSGRMAKRSKSIVLPPNPSTGPTLTRRAKTTDLACWTGVAGWRVTRARPSIASVRSANASMPAGETGTSSA
jgi:transposase